MRKTDAKPAESWATYAKRRGIDPAALSRIARAALRDAGERLSKHLPPPHLINPALLKKIDVMCGTPTKKRAFTHRESESERNKLILEKIDEHIDQVGNGLVERVATECGVPLPMVLRALKERHEALKYERKMMIEVRSWEAQDARARAAPAEAAARAQDEVSSAAPRPAPPRPVAALPAAPEPRAEALPPPQADVPLDDALRAAWIADRGGDPTARRDAVAALCVRFPGLAPADADAAIAASYVHASPTRQAAMERRATRFARERLLPKPDAPPMSALTPEQISAMAAKMIGTKAP